MRSVRRSDGLGRRGPGLAQPGGRRMRKETGSRLPAGSPAATTAVPSSGDAATAPRRRPSASKRRCRCRRSRSRRIRSRTVRSTISIAIRRSTRSTFRSTARTSTTPGRTVASANAAILKKYPTWVLTIEGHCDERGTAEYNIALGERRAVAVKTYLVSLGIAAGSPADGELRQGVSVRAGSR